MASLPSQAVGGFYKPSGHVSVTSKRPSSTSNISKRIVNKGICQNKQSPQQPNTLSNLSITQPSPQPNTKSPDIASQNQGVKMDRRSDAEPRTEAEARAQAIARIVAMMGGSTPGVRRIVTVESHCGPRPQSSITVESRRRPSSQTPAETELRAEQSEQEDSKQNKLESQGSKETKSEKGEPREGYLGSK